VHTKNRTFTILFTVFGAAGIAVGIFPDDIGNLHGIASLIWFILGPLSEIMVVRFVSSQKSEDKENVKSTSDNDKEESNEPDYEDEDEDQLEEEQEEQTGEMAAATTTTNEVFDGY
jgi:hypothetical protein